MIGTLLKVLSLLKILTSELSISKVVEYLNSIDDNRNGKISLLEIAEEVLTKGVDMFKNKFNGGKK